MKMVVVFLLIMTNMGTSFAWNENEEIMMKVLKDNDKHVDSENGTEIGVMDDDVTEKSELNTPPEPKSTLPPYKSGDDKTPYLKGNQNKQTKPARGESFPMKQTKPFISSMEPNFQPQIGTVPSNDVSAQTLPGRIQFNSAQKQPYVAGQNKQQYLRGKQTKPFEESQDNLGFSPEILVKNPDSNIFAQTIPSPIQFAQTKAKQPYVAGQNKQQYLRGRQTKPFPANQQEYETPTYILLNPRKQTKPASNIYSEKQSLPNDIQFVESQDNLGFSPEILVKNSDSNIFAQTIPSPIQFAQTETKQPYVAGQNKQQYLRGRQTKPFLANSETPTFILLEHTKQTKPSSNMNPEKQSLPNEIQFEESQDNLGFSPQILVKNPDSNSFAQTLPSPIQFAKTGSKQPYVAGQNKQQYLRGRQTKPFQADKEVNESPAYLPLKPFKQTKPFPSGNGNMPSIETLPSPILFDNMNEYSPQILVQTPSSGLFAQTLPSPIQFDQTVSKQPYIPGQNKQQYLRNRQTKPFQADLQERETPNYLLLKPIRQTKPFPTEGQNIILAETGQIEETKPFLSYQAGVEEQLQTNNFLPGVSTRPRFPPGYPLPASRSAGSFLPGVSTRPRFPPGYTLPAAARTVQTQELPMAGYGGPKTVLYIF